MLNSFLGLGPSIPRVEEKVRASCGQLCPRDLLSPFAPKPAALIKQEERRRHTCQGVISGINQVKGINFGDK